MSGNYTLERGDVQGPIERSEESREAVERLGTLIVLLHRQTGTQLAALARHADESVGSCANEGWVS